MKLATYNVNGINGRLDVLLRWLEEAVPDAVCLQELKAPDTKFPERQLERAGYGAIWHGQKSWNGVAILARGHEPIETRRGLPGDPDDSHCRYIEAAIDGIAIADIDRIYDIVKAKSGRIDILFANVGIYEFGALGEITEDHFDKTFDTNVRGLLFTVQKAIPLLSKGSSVILTGSIASIKGSPAFSVYNASKAAIRSFARSWIVDLKGRDIRVNVLSPGHTRTPGLSVLLDATVRDGINAHVPLGRMGTPEDVGKAAVFLASDDSSYITGIELFVDGGLAQF